METGRAWWALAVVVVLALCREETGVFGIAVGLFWALGSRNRRKNLFGWASVVLSLAALLVITKVVMVQAGGTPRFTHFTFFFDEPGIGSVLKSYALNPIGAVQLLLNPARLEFIWLSLVPLGLLPLFGWRVAVFLLIPMGLLFPAITPTFFVSGVNYSAPMVAAQVLLGIAGVRRLLVPRNAVNAASRRAGLAAFLAAVALISSTLYGNLFSKTYKLEFGAVPFRYANQYDYRGQIGIVSSLPPYGQREKLLWDLIRRVPPGPITTSWRINPQLSNRAVSLVYPDLGETHPEENHTKYVVIDRLPPLIEQPEEHERRMRADTRFEVLYENAAGVIFRRKGR
jgi:hypothetical protein